MTNPVETDLRDAASALADFGGELISDASIGDWFAPRRRLRWYPRGGGGGGLVRNRLAQERWRHHQVWYGPGWVRVCAQLDVLRI